MYNEKELSLIEKVRDDEDSVALDKLVQRYRPMIDNMYSRYYITSFERNDWYQEALLVCYQTCKLFDGTSGSRFGSFYKMKFKHRVIDIIRRENSLKRKVNSLTEPFESSDVKGLVIPCHKELVEFKEYFKYVSTKMNLRELIAVQYILGHISIEEACQNADCSKKSMRQAVYNCHQKIKKFDNL
ncbi:RNA polymerase sigma factor SigI [Companilactobacillus crustorum]|uniref:DNA-directed RNA polymerase sigma factor n=3 Tax=Companilactobacillus TaxID=2767879 RepID=A0A837RHI3_9LACO|nr:sigma-70 family RNA polymerase sigma factor [Companilactobacillus crustorum]HCD06932.1 sigma-70 family RNA polymerase sigma factor [Lactobacillus sp.]APU70859.1 hypothetical protein BI355_0507 [Companilactobacillus crustorum]KRK42930.1 DNA-directed RNA polymerase sigma factor [Companilactobacillus crustorum JCM 15951]KRO20603.1 DNA-directed RNA polymerase sigma factor [Companilactobacillus crustorum]WDT64928.1 sigma-70 family RNA polymerase sigma factor [Companilactobacillus crustorum]